MSRLSYPLTGVSASEAEFSLGFSFCSTGGAWEGAAGVADSGRPRSWTSSVISMSVSRGSEWHARGINLICQLTVLCMLHAMSEGTLWSYGETQHEIQPRRILTNPVRK